MGEYISIYYHHGGVFSRKQNRGMVYVNGKVGYLGKVDVDYVNLNDIEKICKHFGYETCERIVWLKPDVAFNVALQPLQNDADINAMCEAALKNGNQIHVYFDNCISRPEIMDEAEVEQHVEEEEVEVEEEEDGEVLSEEEEVGDEEDDRTNVNDEDEEVQEDEKEEVEEEEEEEDEEEDPGYMSFEEGGYDYNSEEFRTPHSSDDGYERPANPKFNDQSVFGHVQGGQVVN